MSVDLSDFEKLSFLGAVAKAGFNAIKRPAGWMATKAMKNPVGVGFGALTAAVNIFETSKAMKSTSQLMQQSRQAARSATGM